jgi:PAS fold
LEAEEVRIIAVHPDDLDRIERRMDASFASGEPFEEEMRIAAPTGSIGGF